MTNFTRRSVLKATGISAVIASGLGPLASARPARAADSNTLTIVYPAAPSAFDPNTGPQAVSPGSQSIFRTLYDPFIVQGPDLSLKSGVMETFGWNADRSKIEMTLRQGVKWHDGVPVTMEDVLWNLKRLTNPSAPQAPEFASNKNFFVEGKKNILEDKP